MANLSLRVGCFDDVDANRLDKMRESREGEEGCEEGLTSGRQKKTKSYLSEDGTVHGGWSGRRTRVDK